MSAAIQAPVPELPGLADAYRTAEQALGQALAGLAALDPALVRPAVLVAMAVDPGAGFDLVSRLDDLERGRRHPTLGRRLSTLVTEADRAMSAADRLGGKACGVAVPVVEKGFWLTPPGRAVRVFRWGLGHSLGGAEGPGVAVLQAPEAPRPAPDDVVGLLTDVSRVEGHGRILVTAVAGTDGLTRWVVSLPGIQSLGSTDDPQDLLGAARRELDRQTSYNPAVVDAMAQAGVPAGAQVMLVGHSYGGMTAVSLASDPAVAAHGWDVAAVVTAGSPVRSHPVPAGTRLLTIEATGDPVPMANLLDPGPWADDGRTDLHVPAVRHDLDKVYIPALRQSEVGDEADAWLRANAPEFLGGTATSRVAVLFDGPPPGTVAPGPLRLDLR